MRAFRGAGVALAVVGLVLTIAGAVAGILPMLFAGPTLILVGLIWAAVGKAVAPAVEAASELQKSQGGPGKWGLGSMGKQMEYGQQRMAAAVDQMAAYNANHGERQRLEAIGVKGTGTVKQLVDTGAQQNLNPVYRVEMVVQSDQHTPYDVSIQSEIPTIAVSALAVGDDRPVHIDPADPTKVIVNWMGTS